MRRLRYGVAVSFDGFIAGPNGEFDWIVPDPGIDFAAIYAQFDTLLMGRKTFDVAKARIDEDMGQRWIVVSRTLKPEEYPGLTIIGSDIPEAVAALKAQSGEDIWLMGGGVLFRTLLDAGLVDAMDIAVMPVMLGSGVPLLTEGRRQWLHLDTSRILPSGILMLSYSIEN